MGHARVMNFSAGPAALPLSVLERAQAELCDWQGLGVSVMEISHRSAEFMALREECLQRMRRLLAIPDHYDILFLQGGARLQFAMVPMNLLGTEKQATYINSGHWSKQAIGEAARFADINTIDVVHENKEGLQDVLPLKSWQKKLKGAFVHYTPNETINGIAMPGFDTKSPLVADMSSCLLSAPIDVAQHQLIYACAQKNIGPAGITYIIVDKNCLQPPVENTPSYMDYTTQIAKESLYNTAPTFNFYMTNLVMTWLEELGGLSVMAERNREKADALYGYIDQSDYYYNLVAPSARSMMNVPFILANKKDAEFLAAAKKANIIGIKGHRAVGGMRASIYNALSLAEVMYLIDFMDEFAKTQG